MSLLATTTSIYRPAKLATEMQTWDWKLERDET
jgi:hypothetical protein